MKLDESIREVIKKVELLTDFEDNEVYVLIALARKKNNPEIAWSKADYHKGPAVFRKVLREDNITSAVTRMMAAIHNYSVGAIKPEDFNLYLTINPRNTRKALRTMQGYISEWTEQDDWERLKYFESKWYSSLQKKSARSRKRYYVVDVDDSEQGPEVMALLGEQGVTVSSVHASRNGTHLLCPPFNVQKLLTKVKELGLPVEVKTDDCVNLWCGNWWTR